VRGWGARYLLCSTDTVGGKTENWIQTNREYFCSSCKQPRCLAQRVDVDVCVCKLDSVRNDGTTGNAQRKPVA
jgi:hypothetical protein